MLRAATWLALVVAIASRASAQDAGAERPIADAMTLAGDDACVDVASLVTSVSTWLGRETIAAELGVIVEIGPGDAAFAITRSGERIATRRFDGLPEACADRRSVIALAIALALDAAILETIGVAPPAPAAEPAPVPEPEPEPVPAPAPPRPPRGERVAFALEAEALLLIDALPDVALAGAVALAAHVGHGFRVRAGGLATQRVGTTIGHGGADLTLLAGRVDGCFAGNVGLDVLVGGCVGVIAGAVLAEGRGFAEIRTAEIPWVGGVGRAELRWMPLDVLALGVGIEGLFAIVRPRLDVGDGHGGVIEARALPPAGLGVVISAATVIE